MFLQDIYPKLHYLYFIIHLFDRINTPWTCIIHIKQGLKNNMLVIVWLHYSSPPPPPSQTTCPWQISLMRVGLTWWLEVSWGWWLGTNMNQFNLVWNDFEFKSKKKKKKAHRQIENNDLVRLKTLIGTDFHNVFTGR